jgi:hypothetical protein
MSVHTFIGRQPQIKNSPEIAACELAKAIVLRSYHNCDLSSKDRIYRHSYNCLHTNDALKPETTGEDRPPITAADTLFRRKPQPAKLNCHQAAIYQIGDDRDAMLDCRGMLDNIS